MSSYFIRTKGKVFGPYDEPQLLEMKSKGKITRLTEISTNKQNWQPAWSFPFLGFESDPDHSAHPDPLPSPNEPTDWFYSADGNTGIGPVTATAIKMMLQSRELNGDSLCWKQGQKNARCIKTEPEFFPPVEDTSPPLPDSEMLRPLAASLGWLMFLKIAFLIILIAGGLYSLWSGVFEISQAVAADTARVLLVTLVAIVVCAGLYALQIKTFFCFWKYHTLLYKTVTANRISDLVQAHQSQFLLWKWLSITVIAHLSVAMIIMTIMMVVVGWGWGSGEFVNEME